MNTQQTRETLARLAEVERRLAAVEGVLPYDFAKPADEPVVDEDEQTEAELDQVEEEVADLPEPPKQRRARKGG